MSKEQTYVQGQKIFYTHMLSVRILFQDLCWIELNSLAAAAVGGRGRGRERERESESETERERSPCGIDWTWAPRDEVNTQDGSILSRSGGGGAHLHPSPPQPTNHVTPAS